MFVVVAEFIVNRMNEEGEDEESDSPAENTVEIGELDNNEEATVPKDLKLHFESVIFISILECLDLEQYQVIKREYSSVE